MIHGGPRYLEFDWNTTRLSTQDAGYIVTIARNLVSRVLFIIPVLPHDKNNIERMETAMEVYDRFQPLKHAHPHRRLTAEEARQAEPGLSPDIIGAVTMEEWGVDPHRLVFANIEDAMAHGARALNHTRVTELIRDGGKVIGVRYRAADGSASEARARVVVNASGPWSPEVAAMAGVEVQLRPAKGIHLVYPHRISNFSISAESVDGRDLLLVAHAGFTLLGTTDDDFYGDLDSMDVLSDEVEYLLQAFERVFPAIRKFRPVRTTSGVRPTLFKWRRYEDELSRRYQVFDHATEGVEGFVTIAGADQALDIVNLPPAFSLGALPGKVHLRKLGRDRVLDVQVQLSEPATVTIELLRRQKVVRQVTAQAPAGASVISLSLKHVRRGRYTLQVVATDAGGASSDPVVVQLRIVP